MKTHRIIAVTLVALSIVLVPGLAPIGQDGGQESEQNAAEGTYKIDAVHSTAIFRVHHLGAGHFYGRFNDVHGTFTYDQGDAVTQLLKSTGFRDVADHPDDAGLSRVITGKR